MQRIEVPYGGETLSAVLPDSVTIDYVHHKEKILPGKAATLESVVPAFADFAGDKGSLLFIVNDHTRFTPTARILDVIVPAVSAKTGVNFLVATGMHRPPSPFVLFDILSKHYHAYREETRYNDAFAEDEHYHAGTASTGNRIFLHKQVEKHKNIVVLGSVEPHFFAGYTGGRKAFLPGVARIDSIARNHVMAVDESVQSLKLDHDLHREMDEVLDMLSDKNIFSIQTVHYPDRRIAGVFWGDMRKSFAQAVEAAEALYVSRLKTRYDIVLAVNSPPLDIDLYQIQKSFENTKAAVRDGGVLILVSPCRDGVGLSHWVEMAGNYRDSEDVLAHREDARNLGFHKLYRPALFKRKAKLWAITGVNPDVVERVFIEPKPDLQTALDEAVETAGRSSKVLVSLDAGQYVLTV